jgi:hypothetical protein
MKKKGVVVSPIVFWAIGIVVVFFVIFIVYQLLSEGGSKAFAFGVGKVPGAASPSSSGGGVDLEGDAKKICSAIQDGLDSEKERCFVPYDSLGLEEQIEMIYDSDSGKIHFRRISDEVYTPLNTEIDARLCVVYRDAITNLHHNILAGYPDRTPEYFEVGALGIEDKGGKYQILTGYYDEEENAHFNLKDYRYLYKPDSNHVCFLTLKEDRWGSCGEDQSDDWGIDDDCFKQWVDEGEITIC